VTDLERRFAAEFLVRWLAARSTPESSLRLFLQDHDAMVSRYQLEHVENVRMRAELQNRGREVTA
jgi:hypothetical protein